MDNYTDYFRPKGEWPSRSKWCGMLNEHCSYEWLSPDGWISLEKNCTPVKVFLGGSSPLDFMKHFPEDNRTTLPFWGCNCNNYKGGYNGIEWEKSFTLHYAQGKKYVKNKITIDIFGIKICRNQNTKV